MTLAEMSFPPFGAAQVRLLARLSEAVAVSGNEAAVRRIVLEQVRPLADEVRVDALGNVLAVRHGTGPNRLRVMVAAHMDEVGFMLTHDDGKGLFRFGRVGGLDVRQVLGKPVWVGPEKVPGVIGLAPVHLTSPEARQQVPSWDALRIDVGPGAAGKVKPGMWATFATPFRRRGAVLMGKALDDRIGVATLLHLLCHAPSNIDLLAAFTVQEEIGLRGAGVAAYALDPDLAFVLDCTPARDLPAPEGEENVAYNARLGHGPAVYLADRAALSDPRLVRHVVRVAEELGIPYQFRQAGGGGTDAGAIHKQREGIPSLSISVPARYIHSPAALARLDDWQNTFRLVWAALARLTPEVLAAPRA